MYQRSLAILRDLGDRVGEGTTLGNLALLQGAQGNAKEALELQRQSLTILETTEDGKAKEEARRLLAEWESQIETQSSNCRHPYRAARSSSHHATPPKTTILLWRDNNFAELPATLQTLMRGGRVFERKHGIDHWLELLLAEERQDF